MRRIAFLSFDWNFEIMAAYYEGMQAWLSQHGGVQLVIFNAYGQYANYAPEEGAFEVFNLCEVADYDGFLIQGNRTWPPELRQRCVDQLRALGKPVVSINYELEGACCVGTDNYEAEFGLISKVLDERGCRRPAFVNGLISSWEAKDRSQAFWEACLERSIPSPRFYQASWEMESGVEAALKMLAAPDELPDVVFCCNDDLAVGVQETLQKHGVRVPQDVLVTGFDNREIALRAQPRITTVDRDYQTIGRTALEALVSMTEGRTVPQRIASPARYVFSASAGYSEDEEATQDYAASLYTMDYALKHFFEVLTRFQPAVLNADSLLGVILECERYFPETRCPNSYLMINEAYLGNEAATTSTPFGETSLLMAHSGTDAQACCDDRHVYARFAAKHILPPQIPMDKPLYMVFPLRHGTTCVGTVVTEGVSPIFGRGFLTIILTLLSSSIESARKREILQTVNSRLDDLYVRDQLTGLFNRFGLERYGSIAYAHLLRDFDEAQFIFVDVDWMKQINDAYGHEAGDQALCDTAAIIRQAVEGENAFAMRYGGDEFLLICRRDLTPKLRAGLAEMRKQKRPYDLSLSMGVIKVLSSDHLSVAEAIEKADAKMYEIKKARKVIR